MPTDSERIDELERLVRRQGEVIDALARRADLGQLDVPGPGGSYPDVIDALNAGQLIVAIKRYREHTKVGLKEAKDAVEALARGL